VNDTHAGMYTEARPTTPASGGKYARRVRRGCLTAERETHTPRRHGAPASSGGTRMRPPGSGVVNYQDPNGKHEPRVYEGETLVDPETATIVSGSVEDAPEAP
jgi:hypothetical protein